VILSKLSERKSSYRRVKIAYGSFTSDDADLGIRINIKTSLSDIKSGELWDVVVLTFSFFFLQLVRDTSHWTLLDTAHQVGSEA
jgi:hypothetical protein